MDPITAAIVAAITVGALGGVTKVGEQVIVDTYAQLKKLLKKKFGANSKVIKAVKDLEANPESAARKEVLKEEITAAKADQDTELLKAARALLATLDGADPNISVHQTIKGNQNVQAAGSNISITTNTHKLKS